MSFSTSTGASANYGAPTASLYFTARAEVLIDRSASAVWPVLIDLSYPMVKLWNPTVISVERIAGEANQEGELVLVTKDSAQTTQAPFYMRTIRLVSNQQRVLRIEGKDGSHSGYVDHSLYESGDKTKVVYNGYLQNHRVALEQVNSFDSKVFANALMEYLDNSLALMKKAIEAR